MLRDLPLKYLLVCFFLFAGIFPLLSLSLMSYETAKEELKTAAFNQLDSVRQIKTSQLTNYFDEKVSQIKYLATVSNWFETKNKAQKKKDIESYLYNYSSHHHLDNLFYIDAKNGEILYSAKNDPIALLPIQPSLHHILKEIAAGKNFVITDIFLYSRIVSTPVQFLGVGLYRKDQLVAIIVGQLSITPIDRIMRERSGMGETGETYLVGPDFRMRSDSFLDPVEHSVISSLKGTIEKNGVKTDASSNALQGKHGRALIIDYNHNPVLSSYGPIEFFGQRWAMMAEIDEAEIDRTIARALNHKVLLIISLSLALLLILALGISFLFEKSIRHFLQEIKRLVDHMILPSASKNEEKHLVVTSLPRDFVELGDKMNLLIDTFYKHLVEKERLEQSLHYNQRLESIGALASGISHDFNNILTYMYTYADTLLEDLKAYPHLHPQVLDLISAIDHANALTEQIGQFSRNVKREMSPTSFSQVLRDSLKLMSPTFQRRIHLSQDIEKRDFIVLADRTSLHQIVINLCTNAYHALLPDGGRLHISLQLKELDGGEHFELPPGEYALLLIEDSGMGIPQDIQDKVFEPYFSTKAHGKGSGMGLTIVQRLVRTLNGKIWFVSVPTEGTSFYVLIPLLPST